MPDTYTDFLPARYRSAGPKPTTQWWPWRDKRIHILAHRRPDASVRIMGIHGAGGHATALWSFAAPLAAGQDRGDTEILWPDMPLYGYTVDPRPARTRYRDWLDLLCDLVVAETDSDPRPLILFGASMGGMMAYEVAARTGRVAAVIATCLLDTQDPQARAAAARWGPAGRFAPALLPPTARVAGNLRIPIAALTRMNRMSNDPRLSRLCATDPRGGGVRVPLGFLADWFTHIHTAPEDFHAAPVILTHPADDRWTPPAASLRFLDRMAAPTRSVLLENCGHWPIEEPGLTQLVDTVRSVVDEVVDNHH